MEIDDVTTEKRHENQVISSNNKRKLVDFQIFGWVCVFLIFALREFNPISLCATFLCFYALYNNDTQIYLHLHIGKSNKSHACCCWCCFYVALHKMASNKS